MELKVAGNGRTIAKFALFVKRMETKLTTAELE